VPHATSSSACGVALVNIFLGWTVIGWFVAFIWQSMWVTPKPKAG
jgi:hypothetical protein